MMMKRRFSPRTYLSLTILLFGCLRYGFCANRAEQMAIRQLENTQTATRTMDQELFNIVRQKVQYDTQNLKDPFKEPFIEISKEASREADASQQAMNLTVQGVIWNAKVPQAIINNKVVKIGDTIEGVKIINITKEGITVFSGKGQYILSSPGMNPIPSPESQGGYNE